MRLRCERVEGTRVRGAIAGVRRKWRSMELDEEWEGELEEAAEAVLKKIQ